MCAQSTRPEQTSTETVADAPVGNWVDRYTPNAIRPYLRLSRADRPVGTWLLFLPCLWGIALALSYDNGFTLSHLWICIGCAIGSLLMRGAGCTWNDIVDMKIDAKVARTKSRPLPSGQVSKKNALLWMVLQVTISGLILLTFNSFAIFLGISSLVLVAIYPFAKRFTWWPQAFLGLTFNWGILLGFAAIYGGLTAAAINLYCAGIAWTIFYDTIYAHQDAEDDALIGVRSTALYFGNNSPEWLRYFLLLTVALITAAIFLTVDNRSLWSSMIALLAPWAFGWHLTWQLNKFDPKNPDTCLKLFRSNRDAGLITTLFLAISIML